MKWILFLALITGCASLSPIDLQNDPYTVVQVTNDNYYTAAIYLNGGRIGLVSGNHKQSLFVHDSQLRDGRCATVVIRLVETRAFGSSSTECVRTGGSYRLDINAGTQPVVSLWPR